MIFEGIIQSCSNVSKLNFVVASTGDRHGSVGQKSLVGKEEGTLVLLNRSGDEIYEVRFWQITLECTTMLLCSLSLSFFYFS